MKLTVVSTTGKNSTLTVKDEVFGLKANADLVAQAVRVYLHNQRQGTNAVKTRAAVARTKKKWFRQKGTGNARHGARSAPLFVGGGVAHGPKANQNWSLAMPTKMKRRALATAFSAQADNIKINDDLIKLKGKTKEAAKLLGKVTGSAKRILVIVAEAKPEIVRSLRNLDHVIVSHVERANIYEVLNATDIIVTKDAVKKLEERLA